MINCIKFISHLIRYFFTKQSERKYPWNISVRNAELYVKCTKLENAQIISELGRGANGIVFKAHNPNLKRYEAVKIWLNLREDKLRDKTIQALEEARKQVQAAGDAVVQIYTAEMIGKCIIARMEYVDGVSLKEHLKHNKNDNLEMLSRYLKLIRECTKPGIYHGDPHDSNVLVYRNESDKHNHHFDLKLCDFGTSYFEDDEDAGKKRHWQKVDETVQKLAKKIPDSKVYWKNVIQQKKTVTKILADPIHLAPDGTEEAEWLKEMEQIEIGLRLTPYTSGLNDMAEIEAWRFMKANSTAPATSGPIP